MKIYVVTDMEGVAGVLDFDNWCNPGGEFYKAGRELLTLETNAAVEGLFQGGATAVSVLDGHGQGGLEPSILDPRAELVRGAVPESPAGLDDTFDGVCWVGQHAKAGTPYSHLTHTQNFSYTDILLNGVSIGEYGLIAIVAMELGIPSIFASGEQAFCEEARDLTPGIVTVSVKKGLLPEPEAANLISAKAYSKAKLAAQHLSPQEARQRIKKGACEAMQKLKANPGKFSYLELKQPYEMRCIFRPDDMHPSLWELSCSHDTNFRSLLADFKLRRNVTQRVADKE